MVLFRRSAVVVEKVSCACLSPPDLLRSAVPKIPNSAAPNPISVRLGLVCMTTTPEVRFRTVTRARFLSLSPASQESTLRDLYEDNLRRLFAALSYCSTHQIALYRALCGIFPLNDEPVGSEVLAAIAPQAARFGSAAEAKGIRVLMHPDQFVVLNSEKPNVVQQSVHILSRHAHVFDVLGLPRSPWSALILHGGKSNRAAELARTIAELPPGASSRLVLENDERAFSARQILEVCQQTGVPMVFDPHHHIVREKLSSYAHPSVREFVQLSRETWPHPDWQIAHVSNGASHFNDPHHSELITDFPPALFQVPWVEVEAKGKQTAIFELRKRWPSLA